MRPWPSSTRFIAGKLLKLTPAESVPALLDAAAKAKSLVDRHQWDRLVNALLRDELPRHAASVNAPRLYQWLGIGLDKYGHREIDKETTSQLRSWLAAHKSTLQDVIAHWVSITPPEHLRREVFTFAQRVCGAQNDAAFATWYLDAAAKEPRAAVAEFLFEQAAWQVLVENAPGAPTIDALYDFVDRNPRFAEALA